METKYQFQRDDLIYPELSFKVIGILFEIYKELGGGYRERYYQNAVASEFRKLGFKFQEQVFTPVYYKENKLGNLFMDFLIEDKIVLELKKDDKFSRKNIEQVHSYLKAKNLKLGIIANFTKQGVKYRRILNIR